MSRIMPRAQHLAEVVSELLNGKRYLVEAYQLGRNSPEKRPITIRLVAVHSMVPYAKCRLGNDCAAMQLPYGEFVHSRLECCGKLETKSPRRFVSLLRYSCRRTTS